MLYIHIGTLKTGSTSIQAFLRKNEGALAAQGILYPEQGRHDRYKHYYLKEELRRTNGAGGTEWESVRSLRQQHPNKTIVVSDEGFVLLQPGDLHRITELTGAGPVTVLAYFRDYASWLPSLYAEYTKNGRNLLDFDAYFEQVMAQPTQGDVIRAWGEALGWSNVQVRLFSRETLASGDAVEDFLQAIGTSTQALGVPPAEPTRAAPGWESLEIARAVLSGIARLPGGAVEDRVPLFVRSACRDATGALEPSGARAEYLNAAQRRRCDELTQREIEMLNSHLAVPVPMPTAKPAVKRPFLPSVEHVAPALVADAMARMAVLLAAQVPDGKIERKHRTRKSEVVVDAAPAAVTAPAADTTADAERKKAKRAAKRAAKEAAAMVPKNAANGAAPPPDEDRAARKARKAAAKAARETPAAEPVAQ